MATCAPNATDTSFSHDAFEASFGGYNCSFVLEPDQTLFCLICARVLREPQLTDCCGNHYCSSCLKKWLKNSPSCPLCREKNFGTLRDKKTERRVQELEVKCTYKTSGCNWTGGLGELSTHLRQDCPCVLVECTNMCGSVLQRRELPTHKEHFCLLRKVHCKYCSLEGAYKVIISEHYDACPKVPVTCPNSCSNKTFPREELLTHVETCPLETISCQFQKFGCNELVARKDLDEHMSAFQNAHLLLTLAVTARLQCTVELYRTETAQLKEELQKVRSDQQCLSRLHSSETSATLPESQSSFCVVERHLAARANGSLHEPILPLIIQMKNYEQEKRSRRCWVSTPFYTEPFGYKLCLCVYANGCCSGEGTHLSVYIHLMAGEFDDELDWPAEEAITVELQNQVHSTHNHWVECNLSADTPVHIRSRVRGGRNRARWGSGTPTFIPLSELSYHASTNCQYLKNDCLYFYIY